MTRTLQQDLELVLSLLPEVKNLTLKYYESQDLQVEHKAHAGNSPVTQADKEIDLFLQKELLVETPDYGWLSEEIEDDTSRLGKKRVWIVDPIDGTREFIHQIPEFVASIGLVEDGVPVLGVIYNPVTGDLFTAIQGDGLYLNGEKMPVMKGVSEIQRSICLTSNSETHQGLWAPYDGKFIQKPVGSIAYKLALVAAGKCDFMVTLRPKNEWDMAAGHALCLEAGLKIEDFDGQKVLYNKEDTLINRAVVARKEVFDEIFELIHKK